MSPGTVPRRIGFCVLALAAALALPACQTTSGQSRYGHSDVGRATLVEFGTVIASRPIDIKGQNSGTGALVGGTAGGFALSNVGSGSGNAAAIIGGVIAGAAVGALAEQGMSDRGGIEYTITLANGKTVVLAQEQEKGDRIFGPGDRVMVQANGTYQRVLAADHLPAEITRPQGVKVKD